MRYGYYIAEQKKLCGDKQFADEAKEIYDSFGIPEKHIDKLDGVSIFLKEDGTLTKRVFVGYFSIKATDI